MPNPARGGAGGNGYEKQLGQNFHSPNRRPAQGLRCNIRFRRATERLHELGPRSCAEAIVALAEGRDALSVVASYAAIDERLPDAFSGRSCPPAPMGLDR
jgi:hypothetical protein